MDNFDRRAFLKIGSLSLFGYWGLGDVLRLQAQSPAPAKRDISIIHLWLTGGMSQLDTFDPKPKAPLEAVTVGTRNRRKLAPGSMGWAPRTAHIWPKLSAMAAAFRPRKIQRKIKPKRDSVFALVNTF